MEHRLKLHRKLQYVSGLTRDVLLFFINSEMVRSIRPAVFFLVSTLWSPRRTWYKFYVGAISNDEIAHRTKPNMTVEKSVAAR